MEPLTIWNELSYFDGLLFSVWIGIMYYGKNLIDDWFGKNK